MIKTIDVYEFKREFENYDRDTQFTEEALEALFDWYEEANENWELDVIGICCDWGEYTKEELINQYGDDAMAAEFEDEDEWYDYLCDEIGDQTHTICLSDTILVMDV